MCHRDTNIYSNTAIPSRCLDQTRYCGWGWSDAHHVCAFSPHQPFLVGHLLVIVLKRASAAFVRHGTRRARTLRCEHVFMRKPPPLIALAVISVLPEICVTCTVMTR
jgi:hypothetical protein